MAGFDLEFNKNSITNSVYNKYYKGKSEVEKILSSAGYKDIIKKAIVGDFFVNMSIEFQDGVSIEGQDIIQVLCYGGQVKKEEEFIKIPPNATMAKYLGARK